MANFASNASGAMLLSNLIQVTESISGSVVPLAMLYIEVNFIIWVVFVSMSIQNLYRHLLLHFW